MANDRYSTVGPERVFTFVLIEESMNTNQAEPEHNQEEWERSFPRRAAWTLMTYVEDDKRGYELAYPPSEAIRTGKINLYWWRRKIRNMVIYPG